MTRTTRTAMMMKRWCSTAGHQQRLPLRLASSSSSLCHHSLLTSSSNISNGNTIRLRSSSSSRIHLTHGQQHSSFHSSSLVQAAADALSSHKSDKGKQKKKQDTTDENDDDKYASLFQPTSTQIILDRVEIQRDDNTGVAQVILARPAKLNALDLSMLQALAQAGRELLDDKNVRAVILRGRGRAFCAGLDVPSMVREITSLQRTPGQLLKELLERPSETKREQEPQSTINDNNNNNDDDDDDTDTTPLITNPNILAQHANLAQQVGYQWRQLPAPVICCLHGVCFGGGLQIALGADMRYSTPDAQLSIMETKWGLIPDMSATVTLRELNLGIDVAKELTMTGRKVTGEEARALGLVTRVSKDPLAEALQFANDVAQNKSPDAVALAKHMYQATWRAVPEEYCLTVETELQQQLIGKWNQWAAAGRNFGWKIPYFQRKREYSVPAYWNGPKDGSSKNV